MQRRKFGREFKLEAVKLVRDRGVSIAQAARDLDVHEAVLPLGGSPTIETGPTDAKMPTCLADIAHVVSVLAHPQLMVRISPEFVHRNHPSCH